MDRVYSSGAAGTPPSVPASPSAGYPSSGNPVGPVQPTKPGAYWYHMIMEELMFVVSSAGITPAAGTLTQVKQALDALYQPKSSSIGALKNLIINGGCQIAQRASVALTTSPLYGQVDRFAAWGTGTAVSAGMITQDTAASIGRTGYALKLSGVTITGAGVVLVRQRIESENAKRLKNQAASFSVQVYHDVGSTINYVVTIRKPTAANNYTGTTIIATGSAVAVATATGTQITLPNVAMGDCSNGIEIEVQAQCGAVTTKNFSFTEWQIEEGATVSTFDRRDVAVEMSLCTRYFQGAVKYQMTLNGLSGSSYGTTMVIPTMRATPTASNVTIYYNPNSSTSPLCQPQSPNSVQYAATFGVTGNPTTGIQADLSAEL